MSSYDGDGNISPHSRKGKAVANIRKEREEKKANEAKIIQKTKETENFFQQPETKTITDTGKGSIHTDENKETQMM